MPSPVPPRKPMVSAKKVFEAVRLDDTVGLAWYLKQGAELGGRNTANNTALHYALVQGRGRAALMLVEAGAPVDARGDSERTPLMLALALNANKVAAALLEKGADTSLRDKFNATALDIVKASGNTHGMQLLFARLDKKELHAEALWAIREEDLDSLKFLVEKMGVNLSSPGPDGTLLAIDMALWGNGDMADYVARMTARETAKEAASGLRSGIAAPKTARFTKRNGSHGPS